MITSIFSKTRPINYIILSVLLFVFYIVSQNSNFFSEGNLYTLIVKTVSFFTLLGSMLLIQFIFNRNNLVKDNMYGPLFFLLFCVLFPGVFNQVTIIGSLFFLVLAFRRLISLKSMIQTKQKLFDASVFILIASVFHSWNILFLIVVFVAILIHVASDFKNWLIPFIAIFIISSIILLYAMLTDRGLLLHIVESAEIDLNLNYFKNNIERISVALFSGISLLFLISSLISYSSKPLNQHAAYRILYLILFVSIGIFIISPNKSNALLAFCLFPVCIFGSNMIEKIDNKWIQEAVLILIILISLTVYFIQL